MARSALTRIVNTDMEHGWTGNCYRSSRRLRCAWCFAALFVFRLPTAVQLAIGMRP
jgi:hypothetical protein